MIAVNDILKKTIMKYFRTKCVLFQYYVIVLLCITTTILILKIEKSKMADCRRANASLTRPKQAIDFKDAEKARNWKPFYAENSSSWIRRPDIVDLTREPIVNAGLICGKKKFLLLVVVLSDVDNFKNRIAIRETWGSDAWIGMSFGRLVFVVGRSSNETVNSKVIKESNGYLDVIQGEFKDDGNATLKSLLMMRWVQRYCPQALYLLRVEDDVFVNIPNILHDIETHSLVKNLFLGSRIDLAEPNRNPTKKDYIPQNVYPYSVYPVHLEKSAYLVKTEIIKRILGACRQMAVFAIENVFISGTCRQMAGLVVHNHDEFVRDRSAALCDLYLMETMRRLNAKNMYKVWESIQRFQDNIDLVITFCGTRDNHKKRIKRFPW